MFGLTEIERPQSFAFAGAWFQAGRDELHLIVESDTTMKAGAAPTGPGLAAGLVTHIALEVEDLEQTLATLLERGAEIGGGPMARGDGVDQAFLLDPDGHVIEVFQRTGADQSNAPARIPVRAAEQPA